MKKSNYSEKFTRSSHYSMADSIHMIQHDGGASNILLHIWLSNLQSACLIPFNSTTMLCSRYQQPHFSEENMGGDQREGDLSEG